VKIKDIMCRNVRTVTPDTLLKEVSSIMCLYRLSGLPVVQDGKLLGFIAEKDLLARSFPSLADFADGMHANYDEMESQYKDVMAMRVSDVMTTRVISVSPEIPAMQAAATMVRHKFRRIPVAHGDKLEGMVSLGDVHKALFHAHISKP
jgi:CBS domain-containing protein